MELLIPTLYKISTYQFLLILWKETNCEQSSITVTLHVDSLYLKCNGGFFSENSFPWGDKRFWENF